MKWTDPCPFEAGPQEGLSLADVLLRHTRIYVKLLLPLVLTCPITYPLTHSLSV